MKITNIYLGTWFQRTNLHLEELFAFFQSGRGNPDLEPEKLQKLHHRLALKNIDFREGELNRVTANSQATRLTISEDGVILVEYPARHLKEAIEKITQFYETQLAPAVSYLFSLGAPLPKELKKVRHVYPLMLVVRGGTTAEIAAIFRTLKDTIVSTTDSRDLDMFLGRTVQILRAKSSVSEDKIEEVLAYTTFFREFEEQLATYLRLHRTFWGEISAIRENSSLRVKDFSRIRSIVLDTLKTLSYIQARIEQMENILDEREAIIAPSTRTLLGAIRQDSFSSLHASQKYISRLWEMTTTYAQETLGLLETLYDENSQRELSVLNFMVFLSFITGFFGMNIAFLPWDMGWQSHSRTAPLVLIGISVCIAASYVIFKRALSRRRFRVHVRTETK